MAPWLEEPLRDDKELNSLLDAYKKQNTELAARREAVVNQGIRQIVVSKNEEGSKDVVVTLELERALLSTVIGRILNQANISYAVEPGLLRGTVTSRLVKVPLIQALNVLLAPLSLVAAMYNNVVVIREGEPADSRATEIRQVDKPITVVRLERDSDTGPKAAEKNTQVETKESSSSEKTTGTSADVAPSDTSSSSSKGGDFPGDKPKNVVTREISLKHIDPPIASAILDALAKKEPSDTDPGLRFSPQPYTNSVFLTGSAENVARAASALRRADRDPAHVVIEVLVVEVDVIAAEELGVDVKSITRNRSITTNFGRFGQFALDYISGQKPPPTPTLFQAQIDLLVSRNKAKIIARPYLATASGRKAKIDITKDQYLIVQQASGGATISAPSSVSTGVKLEIMPQVTREGIVRMDVSVEQSQFVESFNSNVSTEVDKNLAQTTMEVESGQAILIGGMSQHVRSSISSGLPWLRHIPIVNILFSKFAADSRRQEVLVYVTPYIWPPDLSTPIPEPDAFGPKEPRDLFTTIERGGR